MGNDVVIDGIKCGDYAALPAALGSFPSAFAHVHVAFNRPAFAGWAGEPFLLGCFVGERLPHATGSRHSLRLPRLSGGSDPAFLP